MLVLGHPPVALRALAFRAFRLRWLGRATAIGVALGTLCVAIGIPSPAAATGATAADGGARAAPPIRAATVGDILAAARAPGARAVLVNVWATWCDPCRDELPDLLRFYRENRARGLRLVLISADDPAGPASGEAARYLAAAAQRAGFAGDFDALSFIKQDDDMAFIAALDPRWSGALPATFLYDGGGRRTRSWLSPITYQDLSSGVGGLRTDARLTKDPMSDKTDARAKPRAGDNKTPRRQQP